MTSQLQFPMTVQGTVNPAAAARAKSAGMALAAENTRPDWAVACRRAIELMARRGVPFQAADLIAEGLVDEPEHSAQWGPAFAAAARAGLIEKDGAVPSKRATVHGSLCRQWVGVKAAAA
jgi:hypothetical protein